MPLLTAVPHHAAALCTSPNSAGGDRPYRRTASHLHTQPVAGRTHGPRLPLTTPPELEGRVVSIDAAGCRKDIARTIAAAGGWYLLAVKGNESHRHAHRQRDFAYLDCTGAVAHDRCETVEWAHGRSERRTCTIMGGANSILDEIDPDRRGTALGCVVRVVAKRTVRGRTARAVRHCITNLPVTTGAARMADLVRGHWRMPSGHGNSLHWVLDDTPGKTALRRIALNFLTLLQQYFWPNMSIRRLPGWWPETPRDWNRSWPCDDFVNALNCRAGEAAAAMVEFRGLNQTSATYHTTSRCSDSYQFL